MKVSLIDGRNTSITLFYICTTFDDPKNKHVLFIKLETFNYPFSTYEELVEVVKKLKKQICKKVQKKCKKFFSISKRIKGIK